MKTISRKSIRVVLLLLVGLPVLTVTLFYFYPVPQIVKEKYKGEFQKCIYPYGIGYFTPIVGADAFHRLYNSKGEVICNSGGFWGKKPEGPCAQKMCFPIYDN